MTFIDSSDDTKVLQNILRELAASDPAIKLSALHQAINLREKAPRKHLIWALRDRCPEISAAAAKTVEALKPWITDEQWLETLQEHAWCIDSAAIDVLIALGKDVPLEPLFNAPMFRNKSLRYQAQNNLRSKIALWPLEKQDQFIQFCAERLQQDGVENHVIALEMLGIMENKVPIEAFLPALEKSETRIVLAALEQLRKRGKLGSALPFEPFAKLLSNPDARVRRGSLLALDTQNDVFPLDLFIAALRDSDQSVVHTAASILGRRRVTEAIPDLLEQLLTDPNDFWMDYTDSIRDFLHELYEYVPLERLLKALEDGTNKVRLRAIILLSLLQERTPISLLLRLLDHKDPTIRKQAVIASKDHLARIPRAAIVKKLKDRRKEVRQAASWVLLSKNEDIPTQLLLPLLKSPETIARTAALKLLGKRTPLEQLIAAVHDHTWTVREAAIEVLGTLGTQVPLDLFLEALGDSNLSVRRAAIIALSQQSERTPIPLIVKALHDRRRVSQTACEVLQKLGIQVPRTLLLQALHDPIAHVRLLALRLLATIPYEESLGIEILMPLLHDGEGAIRRAAMHQLGSLPAADMVSTDMLNHLMQDSEGWVRIMSLNLLLKRGVIPPAEPFLAALAVNQNWVWIPPAIQPKLGFLSLAEPMMAALNDDNPSMRRIALHILSLFGNTVPVESVKALIGDSATFKDAIECLRKTHPEALHEVAEEASAILLKKDPGQIVGSLIQERIAEAIGSMSNPGSLLVNKLVTLLDWPYGRVRRKAEQALAKLGIELMRPTG